MKHLHHSIAFALTALILVAAVFCVTAQNPSDRTTVKISMDSAYVMMGRLTPLHIDVTTTKAAAAAGRLDAPADTLTTGIEVASSTAPDTATTGGGRVRITTTLMLQAFDSGNYVIPPVRFINGTDTTLSNSLALKVIPVNTDTISSIIDYAPTLVIKSGAFDWVPDWIADYYGLWLALLILLAGIFAGYWFWYRKRPAGPIVIRKPKPQITPWDEAIRSLEKLHSEQLWEHGQEKEFYTRLTDILRRYVDRRFHINAQEMTSAQILHALRHDEQGRLPEQYMRQVLAIADYVKFARMRPFSEDNVKAYSDAVLFVRDTTPAPEPAETH